jgi:hypothetical protein
MVPFGEEHPDHPDYRWGIDVAGRSEDEGGFRPDFIIVGYRNAAGEYVIAGSDKVSGIKMEAELPDPEWPDMCIHREIPTPRSFTLAGRCHQVVMAMTASYETSMQAVADLWRRER